MTREELNKESQQYTLSHTTPSLYRVVDQAYLAGAEPREKRIAELEDTNKKILDECHKLVDSLEKKQKEVAKLSESREKQIEIDARQIRALQKQNGELTDRLTEAKEIIGIMRHLLFDVWGYIAIPLEKRVNSFLKDN